MKNGWHAALVIVGAVGAVALTWTGAHETQHTAAPFAPPTTTTRLPAPPPPPPTNENERESEDDERSLAFRIPSGEPTAISCDEARRIVAQVRTNLAYEPQAVAPRAFAESTADWLDPHGLWSMPSDSPTTQEITRRASELLVELEAKPGEPCAASRAIGATLARWIRDLRGDYDRARAHADEAGKDRALDDAMSAANTELPPTDKSSGHALATELGHRVGVFEHGLGASADAYTQTATDRFLPQLDADGWARVVLAAAVRAYVPLVDPHGGWAPFDEEASIYEIGLTSHPPSQLWLKSSPTAVGVRILEGASAPLKNDDVVLALAGVSTAGLPLEQVDQLAFAAGDTRGSTSAVILRAGEKAPRNLELAHEESKEETATADRDLLPKNDVTYGDGHVLVVHIQDVRDDLGEALARTIVGDRSEVATTLEGVVLDLRGNGGGSTDGAIDALGLFLPGLPLFPMKRRDGTLETDRAPEPNETDRWPGPVATLIDADTASAAEMIAGALASYRRGPSVGERTYGKGCAQEYVDDEAHAGVLRLTTLLYALPDGTAVQRVGLTPTIRIPFATHSLLEQEREASLPHAPPTWRGPDVRGSNTSVIVPWPAHAGHVGPDCGDEDVCRALRAIGASTTKRAPTAKRSTDAAIEK